MRCERCEREGGGGREREGVGESELAREWRERERERREIALSHTHTHTHTQQEPVSKQVVTKNVFCFSLLFTYKHRVEAPRSPVKIVVI